MPYVQNEHGLEKYSRRNMDNKKTLCLHLHWRSFGHWSLTDDIEHHTFLMPFYRACLIPTQSSFLFTLDRKTYNPKDVLRNLNLALLFAYTLITTVCNIVVACLVKRRARQVQLVQNTTQFRVSSYV